MSLLHQLNRTASGGAPTTEVSTREPDTMAMVANPWIAWKGDLVLGVDNSVWFYRVIPNYAYAWESSDVRLREGSRLHQLLIELGRTSRPPTLGDMAASGKNRKVHVASHVRYVRPTKPAGATPELAAFLDEVFEEAQMVVPEQITLIGVELWPSQPPGRRHRQRSFVTQLRDVAATYMNRSNVDLELYTEDRDKVATIFGHHGSRPVDREARAYVSRWLSDGGTDEPYYVEESDRLVVRERNPKSFDRWVRLHRLADDAEREGDRQAAEELVLEAEAEILRGGNAVQFMSIPESGIPEELGNAPHTPWLADAQQHENAATTVSLRFELQPGRVTRNEARKQQKRTYKEAEEEMEASEILDRVEHEDTIRGARAVETHYATTGEPSITKMSMLFAWEMRDVDETFADYLRARWDLEPTVMDHRQAECYHETLPCSSLLAAPKRPYSHDALLATIAHSAIGSTAQIGDDLDVRSNADELGILMGISHPGGTPVWFNPFAASEQNAAPTMCFIGDTGSGKTFAVQVLCYQLMLQRIPVFFINPKGEDSLRNYAEFCGGEWIAISHVSTQPGAFDPFRYAEDRDIVEIAVDHITTGLNNQGETLTMDQQIELSNALQAGVKADAGCVGACLDLLPEEHHHLAEQIRAWARNNANFGLGIGFERRAPLGGGSRFTLVEFDQGVTLPESANPRDLTMIESSSIAAMRLLFRAGIEVMKRAGGGVVAGDEAWTFLSSKRSAQVINSMNRKFRSLQICLMLMTQKIADVLDADMEGYLGRVGVLKLEDSKEITRALALCRTDPTEELMDLIRGAKPEPPDPGNPAKGIAPTPARPSRAIMRDIANRRGVMTVEPFPERYRFQFSTNRLDRRVRDGVFRRTPDPRATMEGEVAQS